MTENNYVIKEDPSKHETLNQCWADVGPASHTCLQGRRCLKRSLIRGRACRIPASLDYRDSRPRSPRTRRDSGMTASFQYSSAVCINPIAMRS